MTKGLSKSRYTAFCQCPKNLWLKMYKPRLLVHGTSRSQSQIPASHPDKRLESPAQLTIAQHIQNK